MNDSHIILQRNKNSVIANNTLNDAALKELIRADGNGDGCIIRDNPGSTV